MKSIMTILTASIVFSLLLAKNGQAGDDEWRTFGEAAAIYLGIRALTGWDPVGKIMEYPRNRLRHRNEALYKQPVNVYLQENRCSRISAFPCNYFGKHVHEQAYYDQERAESRNGGGSISYRSEPALAREEPQQPRYPQQPLPPQKTSKPPVQIEKRIEGDYEIQTKRIWIEPHWESTTIEAHWRGDTWVEAHTEKTWVEGQWNIEEKKTFIGNDSTTNRGPVD